MMLLELGLPGLVFLGLCVWLVRKAFRAARTEQDLESERLLGALADELRAAKAHAAAASSGTPTPRLVEMVPEKPAQEPLAGADIRGANPDHVRLVLEMVEQQTASGSRVELGWVRSSTSHVAWCQRRLPTAGADRATAREVICVARIEKGAIAERWTFG